MKPAKINEVLPGLIPTVVILILFSILCASALLRPAGPPAHYAIVAFVLALSFDWVFSYFVRPALAIRDDALDSGEGGFWSILVSAFKLFLVLAILFAMSRGSIAALHNPIKLSKQFAGLVCSLGAYVFLRMALAPLINKANKGILKNLPSYSLQPEGFIVNVPIKILFGPSKILSFNVRFDELDEVRRFSFWEAQGYANSYVRPDRKLQLAAAIEQGNFFGGDIPRPSHYLSWESGVGTIMLFKGKDLFHFVAFRTEDGSDLLQAFASSKAKRVRHDNANE